MKKEEILSANKLIAVFLGGKIVRENGLIFINGITGGQQTPMGLKYHSSWDWIMPVIDKIESVDNFAYKVILHYGIGFISDSSKHGEPVICRKTGGTRLETTYKLAVDFIIWYNKKSCIRKIN
jgi:hypothetical protein